MNPALPAVLLLDRAQAYDLRLTFRFVESALLAAPYQCTPRHRFGTKNISANTTANGPKKNPPQNDGQKRLPE
jgi:hypothetical protein